MTTKTRTRLLVGGGLFVFFTIDGLLLFGYMYFEDLAKGNYVPIMEPLIEEMTGAYGGAILLAALMWCTQRFRLNADNWKVRVPAYLLGMIAYSVLHTTMNALGRELIFPLAGLGRYDYGTMVLRFPMEFFNDVMGFWMWVALLHLFFHYRESRDREVKTAKLESELTHAQLNNLRAQLQPHFLFNSLNTISSHMYQDPQKADRLMTKLSDLLRATLATSTRQEVPLQEELEVLQMYLDMMLARFEDRLEISVNAEPECDTALVPSMILQPIAENAIRHGTSAQAGVGKIDVCVHRENGILQLSVRDNGPGIVGEESEAVESGIGLRNTVERLRRLYGNEQTFLLTNEPNGGLHVIVRIPFRVWKEEVAAGEVAGVGDAGGYHG